MNKWHGGGDKQELPLSCKCFLNKFTEFSFFSKEIHKEMKLFVWISSTTCWVIRLHEVNIKQKVILIASSKGGSRHFVCNRVKETENS